MDDVNLDAFVYYPATSALLTSNSICLTHLVTSLPESYHYVSVKTNSAMGHHRHWSDLIMVHPGPPH